MNREKVLLICGSSQTVITFRMGLIERLKENGYEVSVIALDETCKQDILERQIDFHSVNAQNRSLNPLGIITLKKKYYSLIKRIRPDIIFTFMLKPNIFGVRAAKKARVKKIFSMVEGAGDVFINNSIKWKIIRTVVCKMYRKSFRNVNKVFFLNNDDKSEFIVRKLVKEDQCEVIPGIGVDLDHFTYKPIRNYRTFLMVARMLKTKGIFEYCACARMVKKKYPDAVFNYLGAEGTVKVADIQEYIDDGSINYFGTAKDVRPYLGEATLFILPSYREGLPMSIMEAEACGRGIITSDEVGCKNTVVNGYNGFLINPREPEDIADKVIWCIEHPKETALMGQNSRKFAEDHFDQRKINKYILNVIENVK